VRAPGVPAGAGAQQPRRPAQAGGSARTFAFFGILLSPVVAAAAMALSSVSVITNSLRLRATRVEV
jgi:cation transport ATPase